MPVNYKYNQAFCEAFGKHLRKLREKKGMTMRQFAIEADIEYSQLSKIERGVINTTISTALTLSNALQVDVRELFKFKFPPE